jgi:hypothetical protein
LKIIFLHGEIFEFPSPFALKIIFNVNGKATVCHTPCYRWGYPAPAYNKRRLIIVVPSWIEIEKALLA